MEAGDLSLGCERCAVHVDEGHPEAAYARVYDQLRSTSSHPQWPQQLELALSNSCNLQCVMCNGELSSAIRIHREKRPPLPPVYGEAFFEELDDFLPHLSSLVFLGGEPFLAKESLRVMNRLVELGLSPHCSITTNGTQWNRRVEELVRSLPTHVAVSLDAASAPTFESTRVGAVHSEVIHNIHRFRDATANTSSSVSIAFCLMRNNWTEFLDLLSWADDNDLAVFVNAVTHPPDLSLVHAPMEELNVILRSLEEQDSRAQRSLGRNLSIWDQEFDKLTRLVRDRQVEAPVSLLPPQPTGGAPADATLAYIETDADQLVARVDPGTTDELGLDLRSLVGESIWNVQTHLCAALGETDATELLRFDDGAEELNVDFVNSSVTTRMRAHLTPRETGAQTWKLEFSRQEDPDVNSATHHVPEPEGTVDRPPERSAAAQTAGHSSTPRALLDHERDTELARDGYTILPFINRETVSELRAIYAVHHGWSGTGFEPDLENPDTEYRHTVSNEIGRVLEDRASALFVRHRPFLRVFLCKWPGEDSNLYIHRDWMYTDERKGFRTFVVWVALQDINEHNGPLQVVPGTHKLDPMLRGTNLNASWLAHQEVLSEHMVQVTARAGEALVFDNQLIHASPPNHTSHPRLVAAVGMKDRDAPLVYFHRRDQTHADRYDVDEEFFLTETPSALLQGPPDREVVESVTVTGRDLDADELTDILRRDRAHRLVVARTPPISCPSTVPRSGPSGRATDRDESTSPTAASHTKPGLSILVVTATPDSRNSTLELGNLVAELGNRPGVTVNVWFLRRADHTPWPGSRVIDDLRTATVPAMIDKIHISPLAGVLRGRILRRWWAEADPDVVILDDALGERALPSERSGLVVVHRINPTLPSDAGLEAPATQAADILLAPRDHPPPEGPPAQTVLATMPRSCHEQAKPFIQTSSRAIVRKRLNLPTGGLLIVGWGERAWLDGPDMFIRTIGILREHHHIDAHGLWAGDDDGGRVAAVIEEEANRYGLSVHIDHQPRSTVDVRLCGDVVLLPYREEGEREYVHQAAVTGCAVVTFPVWTPADPTLHLVDQPNLEAAAEEIIDASRNDREKRSRKALELLDIGPLADELLNAITAFRDSQCPPTTL